ncbi:DNA-binding response regulator [Grimontia sp. SpTr1]|uniref:DNA-binding response regulator n=1 Tax=Grimontia sp. SpTr1 TaxID=2995319 RepID=UPI00248A921F|nr:DNA-binding response regulator [Grimontia sp. SpTr1]
MRELLLIENVLSPCGWMKSVLAEHGCKVTRVLHVKQAERALSQTRFDMILLAGEGALPCVTDVKRLRQSTSLPLVVMLPQTSAEDLSTLHYAGVNGLVSATSSRDELWETAKTAYDNTPPKPVDV